MYSTSFRFEMGRRTVFVLTLKTIYPSTFGYENFELQLQDPVDASTADWQPIGPVAPLFAIV